MSNHLEITKLSRCDLTRYVKVVCATTSTQRSAIPSFLIYM